MLFGNNNVVNSGVLALFDAFPLGTRLQVGVNAGNWIGNLAGFENNVVVLSDAQLFANGGSPIEGIRSVARVPLNLITFVSEPPEVAARPPKPHKKHKKGMKKAKEGCKKFFKKICKVKKNVCECVEKFTESVGKNIESTQQFLNEVFDSNSSDRMQNNDSNNDNGNNNGKNDGNQGN